MIFIYLGLQTDIARDFVKIDLIWFFFYSLLTYLLTKGPFMPGGQKGSHTILPPSPILSFCYMCTTVNFIYINFRSLNEHMADPSPILQAIYTTAFSCFTSSLRSLLDTTFGHLILSMVRRYRFMNTLSFIWVLSGATSKKKTL